MGRQMKEENEGCDKIPAGELLANGWHLADEYTKDLFPGAVFMKRVGGINTPYATYDFTLVKANDDQWVPIHGSVRLQSVKSAEEAAFELQRYWDELPGSARLRYAGNEPKLNQTKVRVFLGANAYACITKDGRSLDVLLSPGRSAGTSLRESAAELRKEIERKLSLANLMEEAAALI